MLADLPVEHRPLFRLTRARLHHEGQHVVRVVAGIDLGQRQHAAEHQPGADQQDERQRHLGDDDAAAQRAAAAQAARAAADGAQHVHHVGARSAQGRDQPAHHRRHHAGQHREGEHHGIHRDRVEARQILRSEHQQHLDPRACEEQAERRPARRDHQALRQHLAHELRAAGADRRADRQLAAPSRRAHDQQVRDVGARDQQHERHGAHQRHDRRPHVADQIVEHRNHVKVQTGGLLDGEMLAQVGRDMLYVDLRLPGAHAGLEPADHAVDHVVAVGGVDVDACGGPHLRRSLGVDAGRQQQLEAWGQDADDARAAVAELDILADGGRIAAEAPQPERVTEDRSHRRTRRGCLSGHLRHRRAVIGDEIAADEHPRAQETEQVRRGAADANLLRIGSRRGERDAAGRDHSSDLVEDLRGLLLEIAKIRWRERPVMDVAGAQLAPDHHEPLRIGVRQRTQQHGVDHAEDGRAGADAERDRDGGHRRESQILAQSASRVVEIFKECVHGSPGPAHVPCLLWWP
jgi:hypothetical protein